MSILASDAFSGTGALGANWTEDGFGSAYSQGSGVLSNTGSNDRYARYSGISWPNDQWSENTVGTAGTGGVGAGQGPIVRKASGTFAQYRFIASGAGWELGVIDTGGTFTSLASGSGTTWAGGDRSYVEAQSTTIIAKKNTTNGSGGSTISTQTDSTNAAGGAGLGYSSTDTAATTDSWQGGDFAGGGRTTKNTRAFPLGMAIGMNWRSAGDCS